MNALKALAVDLLLITPGGALLLLQEWTPFLMVVAGTAGTALAIAVRNYRQVEQTKARVDRLEPLVPKRSTDRRDSTPSAPPAFSPPPSTVGPTASAASSPQQGEVGRDG